MALVEGDRMPSGSTSIQPASDGRFDGLLSVADRLRNFTARLPRANPRIAASVTLLAVLVSAALALVPQRAATTAQSMPGTPGQTIAVPAAPVRIVGAAPRSDNCAEQVWPYIEQRCLTRAADRPKASAPAHAPSAGEAQSSTRATVGAAPADRDAGLPPAPPQAANLPVPPGAVPLPSAPSAKQPSFVQERANLRTESIGEPRRRAGRHSYRSRHGRAWSRRPVFAFPF
jgi:hypothetical protein